jgi:putative ABC transport system permease protein
LIADFQFGWNKSAIGNRQSKIIMKDIKYAIRSLIQRPSFSVVAILTLALSIGANTAIFTVVNAVLLRALPFNNPDQLVSIGQAPGKGGLPGLAAYEYLAWKDRNSTFDDMAAISDDSFNLTGQGEPERMSVARVTASMFTTLGVQPLEGRWFLPEEDRPGHSQVVVVSEGFWQRRFGRDRSLIGRSLTFNDKPYTVVGVMPGHFRYPGRFEVWMPLALDPVREHGDMITLVDVVGRLKSSVTTQQGQTELGVISQQARTAVKDPPPASTLQIIPLHEQLVSGVKRTVLILWGAVALVMLLACANVANLMLSRTIARRREMAVRAAVGASRWQLVKQLLIEAGVLGLGGGLLGVLLATWFTGAIASLVPEGFASSVYDLSAIKLDWRVFGFTLGLSLLTGFIFGIAPALSASRPDLVKTLRVGASTSLMSFGLRSLRGWLVVAELALALILLLSAGLLTRSFQQLTNIDLGFERQNVLTARISLPRSTYAIDAQAIQFQEQLMERVGALPGVESVGNISHTPLNGFSIIAFSPVEGNPPVDREKDKPLGVGSVSNDYFKTLKIPQLAGRGFDANDREDGNKVAIVNQAFAEKYFPNADPLGKRVGFGCKEGLCRSIVGVVGNVKQESLTDEVVPEIYLPFRQMPLNGITLLVRTKSDPRTLAGAVRDAVQSIDKNQPVHDMKTMADRVSETTAVTRSLVMLFSAFALLALVLAVVGVYGVVSYSVNQRTREFGIRIALGAQAADVLTLVMKNGAKLAIVGVVIGLAGAFGLTRFLATLLFGVTPTDRLTFIVVSAALILVAMVASFIPARRATSVDPLVALRDE